MRWFENSHETLMLLLAEQVPPDLGDHSYLIMIILIIVIIQIFNQIRRKTQQPTSNETKNGSALSGKHLS